MDYFKSIQAALDFMEQHLQEELHIRDIASQARFSPFHFQRLFQAISGLSVHAYIRRRRLSEAACLLKETSMTIMDIAVLFQYGSQEAFTRAFESQFGITPAKFRKASSLTSLPFQHKMNFLDFKQNGKGDEPFMHKPVIVQLPPTTIIGIEYKTSLNQDQMYQDIPQFYHDFGQNEYFSLIPSIAPAMPYGISCNFEDDGRFSFVIGEKVDSSATIPDPRFVKFVIPGGTYAEFKVNGPSESVSRTRTYIYQTWLPNSHYERTEGPDFEITDVCNSIYPDDMNMKVYIPLKDEK
ncbi:MAG: effector binding domain-containing protein [Clostridia bacterium]